ncbi:MAG: hypothetical protein KKC86_06840, partial [Bacteroidetes bacterium]|nr:hypothetical protein [Bacteroidota bacterium]
AKLVKPYKVSTKYVKNIGADVLSLGFPVSESEKGKLTFDSISEKPGAVKFDAGSDKVTFSLKEDLKQGFDNWCEAMAKEHAVLYNNKTDISLPAISDPCGKALPAILRLQKNTSNAFSFLSV